mmetsp:Transcript_11058/g.26833  ORF Transcript_11058/g.26833 Transcript_11058/m.26833 type:complete len:116 (+) Transcript_11058:22-369(+)
MRVVFFAVPEDENARPKSDADEESEGAAWVSMADLEDMASQRPPLGLRGKELFKWASYLEAGGAVFPLSLLQEESDGPRPALAAAGMRAGKEPLPAFGPGRGGEEVRSAQGSAYH